MLGNKELRSAGYSRGRFGSKKIIHLAGLQKMTHCSLGKMFRIDRKNPISIPTFIQCLLGSDKESRHLAVTELRVVGSDIEPYVAEIVSRIREADCDVQICVVHVLENMGPNGKEYISVLESIEKHNVKEVTGSRESD